MVRQRAAGLALYARQWLDAAGAEDVVQEAFTALLMEAREPEEPVAWMYRAVRNAAIDGARSMARRKRRERTVAMAREEWFEPTTEALIDARAAEEALRQLEPVAREVVVMRIWGEMGFAEIAKVVGMAVSTVHERYREALEQMRKRLEQPCRKTT
jgi:RNA polymerase sigma-70 factor (ECF subfamily)